MLLPRLLGGDFRQTMPIQEGAVKSELLDLSLKWSPLWTHFAENMFTLTENILVANSSFCHISEY
jgi:hypothetical protein